MTSIRKLLGSVTAAVMTAVCCIGTFPAVSPAYAAGQTLTVGKNGTYKTVNEAVSAAAGMKPSGEGSRITIAIEPGTYREQVIINTPYLTFTNSNPGGGEVLITWYYGIGYKYYSTASSGYYKASDAAAKSSKRVADRWGTAVRLQSGAKFFRAENITFENSFNRYMTSEEIADGVEPTGETLTVQRRQGLDVTAKSATERAAAMCVEADGCEFFKCNFYSSQDTLYTSSRAYFKSCKIQGNTDYIFGSGDVVFDGCELCFGGYSDNAVGGYITAARQQTNGYLFWECTVTGNGKLKVGQGYFGRPWSNTAHVLFYNTKLQYESIITPVGWHSMSGVNPEQATFREYNTKTVSGGGVNTSQRTGGTVLSSCNATREQYFGGWVPYYLNSEGGNYKPAAVIDTTESYRIRNVNSGLYLAAEGGTASAGTNVIQAAKSDATVWKFTEAGGGYYFITAQLGNNDCRLDLDYGKTEDGTNIGLYTDTQSTAQYFKLTETDSGVYQIVTKPTGDESCVAVDGGSKEAGANVLQWKCGESADQLWALEMVIPAIQGRLISDLLVYDRGNSADWSVAENVHSGDLMFGDRDVQYVNLPAELTGAEIIRTACDSKNYDSVLGEFTAADAVTVYIGMDDRVTPVPAWLSAWEKTSLTYVNTGATEVHFTAYAREFAAGETVTLGTNGMKGNCVNYTVFVQQKPEETTTTTVTTTTQPPETTTTTTTTSVPPEDSTSAEPALSKLRGDVDCSGEVNVADAVMLARYLAEDSEVQVKAQGLVNAETTGDNKLSAEDNARILECIAGLTEL